MISIADIDLLALDLKLILTSIETATQKQLKLAPDNAHAPVLSRPSSK
jgi:hypothetical protein